MKTDALLQKIKGHIQKGTYIISAHALERQNQRSLDLNDVLYVLKTGAREENKDLFDTKRQLWKYAIKGETTERVMIRIIVSFEEEMIIITAMRIR